MIPSIWAGLAKQLALPRQIQKTKQKKKRQQALVESRILDFYKMAPYLA